MDLKRAKPSVKDSQLCKRGDYVPQRKDVPEPLQTLRRHVIHALSPLDVDAGV